MIPMPADILAAQKRKGMSFVAWTKAVHRIAANGTHTVCGHAIPSPLKAGAVGFYATYRGQLCRHCQYASTDN